MDNSHRSAFFLLVFFIAQFVGLCSAHGGCPHGKREHFTLMSDQKYGIAPASHSPKRRLAAFQPLRIHTELMTINLDASKKNFLENKLLPEAVQWLQSTLKVDQVVGNLQFNRYCATSSPCTAVVQDQTCGPSDGPIIPTSWFKDTTHPPSTGGPGLANTDIALLVTAVDSATCQSSPTLAYADNCQTDQSDRPVLGYINFCPGEVDASSAKWDNQLTVAIHEITHVLGFNSHNFAFFRDSSVRDVNNNPKPRTPRALKGGSGPGYDLPPTKDYPCPTATDPTATTKVYVPSPDTIATTTSGGVSTFKMITPKVKAIARQLFGCPTLDGAELENQPTTPCTEVASHWEERLFKNEFMSAYVSDRRNVISALTLALLEDSGWYSADYSKAEPLMWGANKGCAFAQQPCLTLASSSSTSPPVSAFPRHWCTVASQKGCTVDHLYQGRCSMGTVPVASTPDAFRYFPWADGGSLAAGTFPHVDYCPYFKGYSNGDCRAVQYNPTKDTEVRYYYGNTYCPGCRCMESSLTHAELDIALQPSAVPSIGCFDVRCVNNSVVVAVRHKDRVFRVSCVPGETRSVAGFAGTLTCPPTSICGAAASCPGQCSARGTCSGTTCTCDPGHTGADCSQQLCPDDCSGRGTCDVASRSCTCDKGWTGAACATKALSAASPTHTAHAAATTTTAALLTAAAAAAAALL